MGSKKRGVGQHHGDLRRALLDSTLALIADGNGSPSLREVARQAGVSQAAPYHHFGSRGGLLAAVAADGFARLTRFLLEATGPSPRERLRDMAARYVRFALVYRAYYRTMFDPELPEDEALRLAAVDCFSELVSAIAAVTPEDELMSVVRRARQAWALAHGAIELSPLLPELGAPSEIDAFAWEIADGVVTLAAPPG